MTTSDASPVSGLSDDPLWYKHAVIYELHVRAFHDSNGDGIGDFRGLTEKLDYLQDLGVTAIWLLPFYPSPLRDDGYDIADYTGVHPSYGTMRDAKRFIREAHKRGLRVITELVVNHTSDQHAWFQRARRAAPGSTHRDFYVWSDTPDKYQGTRIIFQDFEASNWSWDPLAKAYYWHRFYSHQPDLNFDNPAVQRELLKVLDRWFDAGVDGMRLDAVPYLYEREGTTCENLEETHEFLKVLRAHQEEHYPGRMFLAEANQWPEDAVAYFGDGDECHMAFHFPLMPRLFMAVRMEDRFPIIDILQQTPEIPDNCQWALFLRNHDELTLEMVTDEERDYMYRVYAGDRRARINLGIRRRLAPLLQNNRRKIELLNGLLMSMPGTPVIYYGDEIGMGDNFYLGDRDGVRTPMQWSADRNGGFSRANPQQLYLPVIIDPEYHYEAINVEAQQNNTTSLLWWMKRLIALRKRYAVLGSGGIEFLQPENGKVLAFIREDDEHTVLVVANLSRFSQAAELDLSRYRDRVPVEIFGHTRFPPIGELPYFITLGPHAMYWFSLEREPDVLLAAREHTPAGPARRTPPLLEIRTDFESWIASDAAKSRLESVLAKDVPTRRWFRSKSQTVRQARVVERIPIETDVSSKELVATLVLMEFEYADQEAETYAVPLALASPGHAALVIGGESPSIVAHVKRAGTEEPWVLYDAMVDPEVNGGLLETTLRRRRLRGGQGKLSGDSTRYGRAAARSGSLDVHVPRVEQSNSSVTFGDTLILKLFRAVRPGVNPDLEIVRHLTERVRFDRVPPLAGALEYEPDDGGEPTTIAVIQGFVPSEGDGWRYTLDELGDYYERVLEEQAPGVPPEIITPDEPLLALAEQDVPDRARELFGRYLPSAELLGHRTAELHAALATDKGDAAFTPQPFTMMHQRSLYQSLRNSARRSLSLVSKCLETLPPDLRRDAENVLEHEGQLMTQLRLVSSTKLDGRRIRCHGDFHLGQVLWTGRDFFIIDFEGEPARALSERRLKWSPLRDVAGMLRSFHYAAHSGLRELADRGTIPGGPEQLMLYAPWATYWHSWVSAVYLRAYLDRLEQLDHGLLPSDPEGLRILLDAWVLEKAMYEVRYELDNRPDWAGIPLRGVLEVLDAAVAV